MTRLRTITAGGALLLALVLAVLAYLLADSQSDERADVRERFDDIAQVSASVTDGTFQASLVSTRQQAAARLGGPRVSAAELEQLAAASQVPYAVVLTSGGRRLAATANAPRGLGEAAKRAIETRDPWLSNMVERGSDDVVEWAVTYTSKSGQRIYVRALRASLLADFLENSLGRVPNFADAETAMVDGNGVILGGANLSARLGERLPDADLLAALKERDRGEYGDERYFAAGSIEDSPFRIVLDTTEDRLYEDVETTVPWIIFAAFALTALAGLALLRRALASAAELERRQLSERHAVEINDNIIQGLALAKYQLQQGEGEASAAQVSDTLREAQRLVSGLLGEAEVQAGQLRREVAAETTRPEEPAS